ncbi:MAG: CoA-binding protein, partial [bacterium]
MYDNLRPLLAPQSIAVIGASSDFTRIGGMLIKYLLKFGYKGKLYAVNPKYKDIAGIRCYQNVSELPDNIDTALIAVSEKITITSLSDCAARGIKNAIIYTSGFAETGVEGNQKQNELRKIIEQNGLNICGPNCIGIINFIDNIAMSFTGFLESDRLVSGNVGFVSQSGALGGSI